MELRLENGDYVPDGMGGAAGVQGQEALLQRVLFRLTARRGQFPFLEELGSRLWTLGRLSAAERPSAAKQFVVEALSPEEGLEVTEVTLRPSATGEIRLTVQMNWQGASLTAAVQVQ